MMGMCPVCTRPRGRDPGECDPCPLDGGLACERAGRARAEADLAVARLAQQTAALEADQLRGQLAAGVAYDARVQERCEALEAERDELVATVGRFVSALSGDLDALGALNCLELRLEAGSERQPLTLTLVRPGGQTPSEQRDEARSLAARARHVLEVCGCLPDVHSDASDCPCAACVLVRQIPRGWEGSDG